MQHLETWPDHDVDAVKVVIQAGDSSLGHDQLVVVVDADHQQQADEI